MTDTIRNSSNNSVVFRLTEVKRVREKGGVAFELHVPFMEIQQGQFVAFVGPSGCGKSTSLRNMTPDECVVIQPISKRLPFRNDFTVMSKEGGQIKVTDNPDMICRLIIAAAKAGKKKIDQEDLFESYLKVKLGRQKKNKRTKRFLMVTTM